MPLEKNLEPSASVTIRKDVELVICEKSLWLQTMCGGTIVKKTKLGKQLNYQPDQMKQWAGETVQLPCTLGTHYGQQE